MQKTPEIQLLTLCARPHMNAEDGERAGRLLQRDLDWATVFRWAEHYRTTPLLMFNLQHFGIRDIKENPAQKLQTLQRENTRHNMSLALEILRLNDLFSRNGLELISFKGPVSAMFIYSDMSMRACGDIDLLVKDRQHAKAEEVLTAEGYIVEHRYEKAMQSSLWHPQRQVSLDLHWDIATSDFKINTALFWDELVTVDLLGSEISTFSPRDTFLVTAINTVKEFWKPSLHHLSDLAAMSNDFTDEDWAELFERARDAACQRILVAALIFAHRIMSTGLPRVGPANLYKSRKLNAVVDELEAHLFLLPDERAETNMMQALHHRNVSAYYLALVDSPWLRVRERLKLAARPNRADQAFVNLPAGLSFLYFLIRPLRLLLERLLTGGRKS